MELGSDNAAVLFEQNRQALESLNNITTVLATVAPHVVNTAATVANTEEILNSINDSLISLKADTTGIADLVTEANTVLAKVNSTVDALGDEMTMSRLETSMNKLTESHDNILVLVQKIQDEVGPVISKLENSAIFKMLGGK